MTDIDNYLILFADLVGSTDVAVEAPPRFYAETYVSSYHWAARRAMEFVKSHHIFPRERFSASISEIEVAGDEVLCFTPLDPEDGHDVQREDAVASAVALAYVTKLYWLASPYNLRRMLGKQFPRDVAVGIHIGPVASVPTTDESPQVASLHINIAKRIENEARDGRESRIFASYEVSDLFRRWLARVRPGRDRGRSPLSFTQFVPRTTLAAVKGVPKKLRLLELEWPAALGNLTYLLQQLLNTPGSADVDTEVAAKFLAENFLLRPDTPFTYDAGETSAIHYASDTFGGTTTADYIESWFRAVRQLNKLFFDESWLVLNCYALSCSLLRHSHARADRVAEYVETTTSILARLRALMELRQHPGAV